MEVMINILMEKDLVCDTCGNKWHYKGKNTWYATCTDCRRPVRLRERVL